MMNGHVRMMGGIVKVGGERIRHAQPLLTHVSLVCREDYEMHGALSIEPGRRYDQTATSEQPA